MFSTIPQLTLKTISNSDLLPTFAEKVQFNFDQILLHGGGKKGDKGDAGDKGSPGATGIGKKGDQGIRGSQIFYTTLSIISGQVVSDPNQIEADTLIDADGNYFKITKNTSNSNLEYIFQFNINTVSVNTYVVNQNDYQSSSPDPINLRRLRDAGAGGNGMNLFMAKRTPSTPGFTKSEFYRLGIGVDQFTARNTSVLISNILPNDTDPASMTAFAQVAFVYRDTPTSSISGNATLVNYTEDVPNNRFAFSVENSSVSVYLRHDTSNSALSEFIVNSPNMTWTGQSVNPYIPTEYLKLNVIANTATFTAQSVLNIGSDDSVSGQINLQFTQFTAATDITFITATTAVFLNTPEIDLGVIFGVNPLNLKIFQDTTVTTPSGKKWAFDVEVDINNKIAFQNSTIAINGSNQLILTGTTGTVIFVPGNPSNTIDTIVGAKTRQYLTIVATSAPVTITAGANIKLAAVGSGERLNLEAGEAILMYNDGGVFRQISGLKNNGFARGFLSTDYSSDFDNLKTAGVWGQTDVGAMANSAGVASGTYVTEVYTYDSPTSVGVNVTQRQIDIAFSSIVPPAGDPPAGAEVWERNFTVAGGWSSWFRVAYTNKVNDWTATQRMSLSPTNIATGMTGTKWTPTYDGNHFVWVGFGVATIDEIVSLGGASAQQGTEITILGGSPFGALVINLGSTPVAGGLAIFNATLQAPPPYGMGATSISLGGGQGIRLRLFSTGWYVTDYSDVVAAGVGADRYTRDNRVFTQIADDIGFNVNSGPGSFNIMSAPFTYTTPNDGITRKLRISAKMICSGSNGVNSNRIDFRIRNTTLGVTLDQTSYSHSKVDASDTTGDTAVLETLVSLAPATTIELQKYWYVGDINLQWIKLMVDEQ